MALIKLKEAILHNHGKNVFEVGPGFDQGTVDGLDKEVFLNNEELLLSVHGKQECFVSTIKEASSAY